MANTVLIDGVRTPHGTLLGALADVAAVELARTAIDGLLDRTSVPADEVEWVSLGNAIQAGIGQVPGRQAVVESTLPNDTQTTTVNEASGSGVRAITLAADRISAGRATFAIAGGFESMTNAPWILPDYRKGRRYGDVTIRDSMILDSLWDVNLDVHMGEIAERLVDRHDDTYDLSREAQDRYALESHKRAAAAIEAGDFDEEIVPVETPDGRVERDGGPRPDSTMDDLASLPSAFRDDGTVTAANASKLSDGAGVVLLAADAAAQEMGVDPMAELVDYRIVYRDPDEFNEAVGDVVETVLTENDLTVDDIGTCWINEAFAAQAVYVMERVGIPREKMNPRGGAIAFGHPIGASGGMITAAMAHELHAENLEYGLSGMSIGGGGAIMSLWRRR
ncbi:thiolase family protein (plasmid) [Haloferax mediterranei ATCC 33500]|uniref:Acetyl-CoA acetyltransferase n=1 Tax=Haloferax mediterranei (strain ATCC 33500 / DSM 1411 / JCM 8866 / NBRC 14739 / NCIMB 2177 / R-4) TaxID=523841 RepID=I3RAB8_HALMT|nr:thiolase family protein [Haloferax mediterranei]AFK21178.1 acetyl-CoA acetyltransferase [Haloferax mediterranei ATCC 33500]AHZ24703.1 acetyl-CoA acetyltransferase [Haloferax mediterranei ATCC 33500]ELZ97486.1 acetyl-CoA acetyltransferase [Haloferax mediterranei ATCC 33500]MDX5990222.1 thiolase family protein [Haloferax mediterranei ATCC 33500]QCQ76708.1 thiolase family protein [Haloferax mediterranei ATCC 33500]